MSYKLRGKMMSIYINCCIYVCRGGHSFVNVLNVCRTTFLCKRKILFIKPSVCRELLFCTNMIFFYINPTFIHTREFFFVHTFFAQILLLFTKICFFYLNLILTFFHNTFTFFHKHRILPIKILTALCVNICFLQIDPIMV